MAALSTWDGKDLPQESVYTAPIGDLKQASTEQKAEPIAKRMNYELPCIRIEVMPSARKASTLSAGPYKAALIDISPLWARRDVRNLLKRGTSPYTAYYFLRSLDLRYGPDGQIDESPPGNAIFRDALLRTLCNKHP